ncbi:tyrosine-type recombinase/integrase [Arthrobacter sp. H14]|uniref:tyrosine-type recombinase/integrase n=1 Tax=Arthrobacter sp. H14 TaxID=1312959 RepID=UPI0004AF7FA8|nr:site-specific integrase [Arthrobacter sp. H14]
MPKRHRRSFGAIRKLPSKRFQATYTGPDLTKHTAPSTFETREDAEGWLAGVRRKIQNDEWTPRPVRKTARTFGDYADTWLRERTLAPRTRAHYNWLLQTRILPTFATVPLKAITGPFVREWHSTMGTSTPTLRSHAYGLLRTILAGAVEDELIAANPCHIRGAGNAKRVHRIKPATVEQITELVAAMPDKYRALTLLAAWCGLRFGELTELRRADMDLKNNVLHVRRGVVRVNGAVVIGRPKSEAGIRDVNIPPHLSTFLEDHRARFAAPGRDGLLFPTVTGGHLAPATLYKSFYKARKAAGRDDLRWHDLRHTGAVLAASTGATLAELMARLGHSTPQAALRYQHAADGRDKAIAARLSELAKG